MCLFLCVSLCAWPQVSTAARAEAEVHAWVCHLSDLAKLAPSTHDTPTPASAARSARKSRRDSESGASESESGTEWAPTSTEPPHPPPTAVVVRAARTPSAAEGLLSLFGAKPSAGALDEAAGVSTRGPRCRSASEQQLHSQRGSSDGSAELAAVSWVSTCFADRVAAQQEASE
jgi:hypothetical protein